MEDGMNRKRSTSIYIDEVDSRPTIHTSSLSRLHDSNQAKWGPYLQYYHIVAL